MRNRSNLNRPPLLAVASGLLALGSLSLPAPAQSYEGWGIVSLQSLSPPVNGGLTYFHPRAFNRFVPITGLPAGLTGSVSSGSPRGASSVLYRETDRALFAGDDEVLVGEVAPSTQPSVDIHLLILNGPQVNATASTAYPVGTPAMGGGSIPQMALLGGNRVLFTHQGVTNPQLTSPLGILDLGTRQVTPQIVQGPLSGNPAGLAVDAAGSTAFLGTSTGDVYRIRLSDGAPTPLASLGQPVVQLVLDNQGQVIAGVAAAAPGLFRINPNLPGSAVPIHPAISNAFNLAIDRVTGDLLCSALNNGIPGGFRISLAGQIAPFGNPPALGGAKPTGIAVNPSMRTYGQPIASTQPYRWQIHPNPNGAPFLGNMSFTITGNAPASALPGLVGLGFTPTNRIVQGFRLLVNPVAVYWVNPQTTTTISLPVPNNAALTGLSVYAQMAHFVGPTSLIGSKGLKLTVF